MDTLTHALSGALVARLIAARSETPLGAALPPSFDAPWRPHAGAPKPWQLVAVGLVAGAFPDIDVLARFVSDLAYLRHHRGITHSLLMAPLWAALLAWTASWVFRPTRGQPGGWKSWYVVCLAAIGVHIAGDWITQFGTMLLEPFSDRRFGLGVTFIIDLTLSGLILAGLALAAIWPRRRWPAAAALSLVVAWVGVSWVGKQEALAAGEALARERGFVGAEVQAMPRPASPFNWTVVVRDGDTYHLAHVNTRRADPLVAAADDHFIRRFSAPYQPLAQADWEVVARFGTDVADAALAREAWQRPEFAFYRWFAQVPTLEAVERRTDAAGIEQRCAWFKDLRFGFPGRTGLPFRYGLCLGPSDEVAVFKRGEDDGADVQVAGAPSRLR
jgi:inner membrane protein